MTDRIKEAREALEAVELAPKASRNREVCQILFYVQHKDTILKALSAYEKLQGVDLDLMASVYEEERAKYINGRSATMTDKIDEAHEWHKDGTLLYTLKHAGWENGVEQFQNETTIKVDGDNAEAVAETILKALSAYEKLQGVDLDRLLVDIQVLEDVVKIPDVPSMSCLRRSARLVADIGGDG